MDARPQDQNLQGAYQHLAAQTRADGKGKIYVFASPKTDAGTSYVAREMALIAAAATQADQHVLLLDMDLQSNAQSAYFFAQENQAKYGIPNGPYDATFATVPFWSVTPSAVNEQGQNITDNHFMSLHMLDQTGISFSHFHWERFRAGQNVHVQSARPYWHALREHFSAVFIDTPAIDRANVLHTVCAEADANILVSNSADAKSPELSALMRSIMDMGASCEGVILNDGPSDNLNGPMSHGASYE